MWHLVTCILQGFGKEARVTWERKHFSYPWELIMSVQLEVEFLHRAVLSFSVFCGLIDCPFCSSRTD